jgi:hypothetical protein
MSNDVAFAPPILYTGPTPSPPNLTPSSVTTPTITLLSPHIISTANKLFFIAHKLGTSSVREWCLVRVAFSLTMSLYPSALQDSRFLVKFYVAHPNNVQFNAINQRFWLQYHDHAAPTFGSIDAYLITPSDTSENRASCQNLVPVQCWVNLTHNDTYIHGPFDFATVRGRKTRDRICLDDWNVLLAKSSMFVNKVPKLDLPSYSIHVDHGVHCTFPGMAAASHCDDLAPPAGNFP